MPTAAILFKNMDCFADFPEDDHSQILELTTSVVGKQSETIPNPIRT